MDKISTREYVSALRELTEQGSEVSMSVLGTSMEPFLVHQRDEIYFRRPDRPLKKGDMVFYQRKNGQFVMHRIYKIREDGCYMAGDHQTRPEGPVKEEQIFALVTGVRRDGKWLTEKDPVWKFYRTFWRMALPIRRAAGKLHCFICGRENG